jgi:DNA-binding transcriptional MerR regulator
MAKRSSKRTSGEASLPPKLAQGAFTPAGSAEARWEEIGFRGRQVCGIVGISYRQLDYWARTGLLRPSLAEARGSGTQRLYSYRDLVALKVIKSLLDAGVALQTARKAIDYLRDHLGGDLAAASLVLDGSRSVLARTGDDIVDLVRHGQGVLNIVPLGPVVAELDASIHELAEPAAEATEEKPARGRVRAAGGG